MKILLVEDDAPLASEIAAALRRENFAVDTAVDGEEGHYLGDTETYDAAVLGTSDVRNITPEPDKAKSWYQRASQLGSADAQRRLAQMQN